MTSIGTCRKSSAAKVPNSNPSGVLGRRRRLEGAEGAKFPRSQEIESHDDHGDDGEGGRQGDVPRRALQRKDGLADEVGGVAQRGGNDEVSHREGEGEDRAGGKA